MSRPVFSAELGAFFRGLRLARGLGLRQAALHAAHTEGLGILTIQVLSGLEKGGTKNINPDVLRALATLYDVPYEDLARPVIRHRYGLDFSERADKGSGGQTVAVSDRLAQAFTKNVLEAAAVLYDLGVQLQERSADLLGRHLAVASLIPPGFDADSGAIRPRRPRAHSEKPPVRKVK